jgi:hypothetical protein
MQQLARVSRAGIDEIAMRLGLGDIGDNVRRANFAKVRAARPSPDLAGPIRRCPEWGAT